MLNLLHMLGEISPFAKLTMVVAVATFGLAATFVLRPTARTLALMRPVSLAAIFATVSGLLGGWIALLSGIAAPPDGRLPTVVFYQGLAESLATGFVCFGFLAAGWFLVAIGMLRRGNADM
jgi:hypothetical protein